MKETTYNKYKRQNSEMKRIIGIQSFNFFINQKDFEKRLKYIQKCMEIYKVYE